MAAFVAPPVGIARLGLDKLGVVVAALLAVGAASPFAVFRANRIVAGEAKFFFAALPALAAALFALAVLGAAAISSRHTLALINLGNRNGLGDRNGQGGASSADVLALARRITAAVEDRFGVRLEMEPVMVGF